MLIEEFVNTVTVTGVQCFIYFILIDVVINQISWVCNLGKSLKS